MYAAIDEEFEDEEADSVERTDSQSTALETITIEDEGATGFGSAASGDAGGGFMQPDFDPFDPKAWAEREPGLFSGVTGEPEMQDLANVPPIEEIAISGALDFSSSLQRVPSQPSPRPVRHQAQPASPSPLAGQPLSSMKAPAAAVPDSDSDDDEHAQLDARVAMYTLGMPEPQDGVPTAAVPASLAGGSQPFAAAAEQASLSPAPSAPVAQGHTSMFAAEEEEPVPFCVIVDAFLAVEEGELTVNGGEEVYVLGYIEGGWAQVQLLATGEVGNVPEWAVHEVDGQPGGKAESGAIATATSMSQAISDADSALLRATSTPRPAPQPGASASARISVDGPRHRRMASSTTVFSDAATPARASLLGVEDNPFTGGQGGGDDILGLFDAVEGEAAADTTDMPGIDTADPFGLDGLFVTDQGNTAPVGSSGVLVDGGLGEGESASHFERSAPALDPGLVAASGQSSTTSAPAPVAVASVDNPFLSTGTKSGAIKLADIPTSSDNPFGQE